MTGLAAVAESGSYTDLLSKPTIPSLPIAESDVTNLTTDLAAKQATLVSATNIKTVNSTSLLGSGDLAVGTYGLPLVQNAPSASQTVPAGYSMYVPVSYEIAAGTSLEIAANACMEIG